MRKLSWWAKKIGELTERLDLQYWIRQLSTPQLKLTLAPIDETLRSEVRANVGLNATTTQDLIFNLVTRHPEQNVQFARIDERLRMSRGGCWVIPGTKPNVIRYVFQYHVIDMTLPH